MALDTVSYVIMMLCIGLSNGLGAGYYETAACVSFPIFIWIWGLFLIIRYLKAGRLIKTASALGMTGVLIVIYSLIFSLADHSSLIYIETMGERFEFSSFTALAVICMVLGAVFALIHLLTGKKKGDK